MVGPIVATRVSGGAEATGSSRTTCRIMASPISWVATSEPRSGSSAGSRSRWSRTRRSTWVVMNSRSRRAVHSLLTAERSSATAARCRPGSPRRRGTVRTSRSPMPSRPPASTVGQHLAGVDRELHRGQEELVLAAEVVVHQRRVHPGGGGDAADRGARRSPARRTPPGPRRGSPPGCPGCRAAGRSAAPSPPSSSLTAGRPRLRLPRSAPPVGQPVRRRRVAAASTSASTTAPARPPRPATSCRSARRARRPPAAPRPRTTGAARR